MNKSFVRLSELQKKAKQLQKEKSLKWHQALNESAIFYGFTNYKNYQNEAVANRRQREVSQQEFVHAIWSEKNRNIAEKMSVTNARIQNINLPFQELLDSLKKLQNFKKAMRALCEESTLKEFISLHLLIHFLEEDDFEAEHHIANEVLIKNLRYKLVEDGLYVEGEYDVKLIFGLEYDPSSDAHDFLADRDSSGFFELTINRNKEITFDNIDGGF